MLSSCLEIRFTHDASQTAALLPVQLLEEEDRRPKPLFLKPKA